jgi:hypothetical protein
VNCAGFVRRDDAVVPVLLGILDIKYRFLIGSHLGRYGSKDQGLRNAENGLPLEAH